MRFAVRVSGLLIASFTLALPPLFCDPLCDNQARLGLVKGTVFLLTQGAPAWIDAHEGLPLEPGDHLHTEEDSQAEIIVSDNALWFLEPETDVVMDHTEANGGLLHLQSGALLGRVDAAHAPVPPRWEFDLGAAVVSVRGGEFGLEVSRERGARVGLFDGQADMQPAEGPAGPAPAVRLAPKEEGFIQRGKALQVLKKFSPTMARVAAGRADLRARQTRAGHTYSPFTQAVRDELRLKFVAPVAKKTIRRPPVRQRRTKPPPKRRVNPAVGL
jgi:hypothetical protein